MNNVVELFTDGKVEMKDGREFTRLVGGFENDSEVMTTKQLADLMNYDNKIVNKTINRNIKSFEFGVDIIDLKSEVPEWNHEIGYTQNAYNRSNNIYILSKSGVLMYLKFAEGDKAVELYKDFLEDYFRTKAENMVMKSTIEDQINQWMQKKATAVGMTILSLSETDRMKAMQDVEEANKQLNALQSSIDKEKTLELVKPQLEVAELLTNAKFDYDVNTFSKVLGIDGLGRNKLFNWMREQGILRANNEPYQQYMKYFKLIYTTSPQGYQSSKTLIRPQGVEYIIKRLKKDGKVVTKSVSEIISQLENVG